MADVQNQFEEFHEKIRMDYEMASELREKREAVLKRIRKYLKDKGLPGFRELGQGSYTMKTGTKPIEDLEYDIDVGLRFDFHEREHTADEVRGWIYEAVKDHTERIETKKPCIRVAYEAGYHIDITSYAVWEEGGKEQFRLARKDTGWTQADPPALLDYVNDFREANFSDTEDNATKTDQFRRNVRALRRWNDVCLPFESKSKPVGLAFVLLAVQRPLTRATFLDGRPDDRKSLATFARSVANTMGRVVAKKPTPIYDDLFERLNDQEMKDLKKRMGELADALEFAGRTADPVKACERLREVFGDDFPVPEAKDTASKTRAPAIVTSSSSA
jgi:hypothetical protein